MITKMYEQPPDYMETVFRADREKYTHTQNVSLSLFFFFKRLTVSIISFQISLNHK